MNKNDFFRNDTLCVFTDASTLQTSKNPFRITAAPAVIFFINEVEVYRTFEIAQNCHSSYEGEQRAFMLAMYWIPVIVANNPYIKSVKIFTDNITTLKTYRDYIPESSMGDNFIKYTINPGEDPRCCGIITSTVYYILSNNIKMELYHTFGHIGDKHPYKEVARRFGHNNWQFNGITVSKDFVSSLKRGNDMVDHYSTMMLREHFKRNFIIPVQFYVDWKDKELMGKFNELVEGELYGNGQSKDVKQHLRYRISD